ncbi:MAG: hypothetical protein AAFZ18_15040 [Myxococcota bacterium]
MIALLLLAVAQAPSQMPMPTVGYIAVPDAEYGGLRVFGLEDVHTSSSAEGAMAERARRLVFESFDSDGFQLLSPVTVPPRRYKYLERTTARLAGGREIEAWVLRLSDCPDCAPISPTNPPPGSGGGGCDHCPPIDPLPDTEDQPIPSPNGIEDIRMKYLGRDASPEGSAKVFDIEPFLQASRDEAGSETTTLDSQRLVERIKKALAEAEEKALAE